MLFKQPQGILINPKNKKNKKNPKVPSQCEKLDQSHKTQLTICLEYSFSFEEKNYWTNSKQIHYKISYKFFQELIRTHVKFSLHPKPFPTEKT